ncbi:hypothetical protein FHG66_12780 [Rubellimicrobium rubrum]|uniref:Uncharacterized protein n=1 Tax=Rubellimicrobium rubrum TaxID=2585369 RepID=A0A5C4MWQ7_9RHOB|nr:DUF6634 family protein [Rubellimicrobium rubrum]TNC49030.1 hypothetical protein FHG66_12780 [Rubellimicrobium rubrum]
MAMVRLQTPPTLPTAVAAALQDLSQSAEPLLTNPGAPVRLADLPAVWRAHLLEHPDVYGTLVPLGCAEVERADWERLLVLVARQLEHAFRLAGLFALVERGPAPEELAEAPVLSLWAPGIARFGDLVLAGRVTGHPRLPSTWICTSPLLGLDHSAGGRAPGADGISWASP